MLILVWFLFLTMKSDAVQVITAHSGGVVLLTSELQSLKRIQDIRWTHPHLVMSLKNNVTTCHHRRCEMLSDGSLRFSKVQSEDSGNYNLEVFDEDGRRLMKKDFLLRVEDPRRSQVTFQVVCCFLFILLLLSIIFILLIIRRRRNQRRTTGPSEENVYVVMHGHHGNKTKDEEAQEPNCAQTEQITAGEEDVYV